MSEQMAENVTIESSAALNVNANQDVQVESSMAMAMVAGQDLTVKDSLGFSLVAGGNMLVLGSVGLGMAVGGNAAIHQSTIGVLNASGEVKLAEGSQVLMTSRQTLAFGAAAGIACALVSWAFKRLGKT